MTDDLKKYSVKSAIEQIKSCQFECQAGPLEKNTAWMFLEAAMKIGPEYWPGQGVWFEVNAEAAGLALSQWVFFYVVGIHMDSDSERRFWTYSLSYDPPGPYHHGTTHFRNVTESSLRLDKPTNQSA